MFSKRNTMKNLFVAIMCFALMACASNQIKPENLVCNNIPEGSYSTLCTVAHYVGIELEDAGNILKVGNLAGLATDVYSAQEAMNFVNDIQMYLERAQNGYGLLYATFQEFINKKYGILPAKVQAAIVLADQMRLIDVSLIPGADKKLSDYDYKMLFKHLNDQKAIIAPFLVI